jgi:hypothetical protein
MVRQSANILMVKRLTSSDAARMKEIIMYKAQLVVAVALIGGMLLSLPGASFAEEKFYGKNGSYQGRIDDSGKIYGSNGSYQGRLVDSGKQYGKNGSYEGRTDDNGKIYDSKGSYQGRVEVDSRKK